MCLGIPMKVIRIKDNFAQVQSGRLVRTACVQMLPKVKIGDYVIVHAGFAIEIVDPKRAKETLKIVEEIK
jgi:hydrogenase expression/formation protein HypC